MHGFSLEGWDNFFVATAGAAAALAGLLFVALSINLTKILGIPGLPERAGETFLPIAVALLMSILALVPGRDIQDFAWNLIRFGGLSWLVVTWNQIHAIRRRHFIRLFHLFTRLSINQAASICFPLAGLSILCHFPGGLYWLVWGVCVSLGGALMNSWVLLVEILR